MKIGTDAHKELFCRSFMTAHNPYIVAKLPWPELDEASLARLRSVPFWDEVFFAERRAGAMVRAYAETIQDPLVREAIDLQGFEEARHAGLIRHMIDLYGIPASDRPVSKLPADIEAGFLDFGFGECVDSFLGFGAYSFGKRAKFLPDSLFAILATLLEEEVRHIVFFVNWVAYRQAQRGRGAAPLRALHSLWFHGRAVARHVQDIRDGQKSKTEAPAEERDRAKFSATQADIFPGGFNARAFLAECLSENTRRMEAFDPRLLRPSVMPGLARGALTALNLWPGNWGKPVTVSSTI
ncbi:MAG: hypothetical protein NTY59_15595 [Alphaproteobacteria bacterium]|nr:hypothetical protein [Alphaproteobacteria bacterium]